MSSKDLPSRYWCLFCFDEGFLVEAEHLINDLADNKTIPVCHECFMEKKGEPIMMPMFRN